VEELPRHRILTSASRAELDAEIQIAAAEGWQVIGEPALAVPSDPAFPPYWAQALRRPDQKPRIRLLYLDDDAKDVELLRHRIEAGWPEAVVLWTDRRSEYMSALGVGGLAGIISDSSVPDLSGIEALRIARELAPGTPFVFLCGTMSPKRKAEIEAACPDGIFSKDSDAGVFQALRKICRAAHP